MRILTVTLFVLLGHAAIAQKAEKEFLKTLNTFCGQSFAGKAIFPEEEKNPFKGQALKITFATCTSKEVRIPFQVGEDKSRTWDVG